jgi:hypothetical protein
MLTKKICAIDHKTHHPFEALQKREVEAIVVQSSMGAQTPCVKIVGAPHLLHWYWQIFYHQLATENSKISIKTYKSPEIKNSAWPLLKMAHIECEKWHISSAKN